MSLQELRSTVPTSISDKSHLLLMRRSLALQKGVNSFWESREIIVSQQNIDYLLKEICSLKTAPYFPLPRVLVGDSLHEEDSAVIPAALQFVTCLH